MNIVKKTFAADRLHKSLFGKSLEWGKTDCGQMAMMLAEELDIEPPSVGKYTSQGQARRRLRALGYDTLDAYMDLHFLRIKPSEALAGDVMAFPVEDGSVFGVSLGLALNSVRAMALHPVTGQWDHIDRGVATMAWRLV